MLIVNSFKVHISYFNGKFDNFGEINRKLKFEIEKEWEKAGIPTQNTLKIEEEEEKDKGASKDFKIIVIDDEKYYTDTLAKLLELKGYNVWAFNNGKEALKRIKVDPPSLVILDLEMPDISGIKLIEEIKKDENLKNIPILLMTAGPIKKEEKEKASVFLCKPFMNEDLIKLVQDLLKEDQ